MAVIVHHRDAALLAANRETPVDAAERRQPFANLLGLDSSISSATATAAMAFSTLCSPGTFR